MINHDSLKSAEEKLKQDIENVKLALKKLTPDLHSLLEKQNSEGEPQIKNRGLFDVRIDRRAINRILFACGFPADSLSEIRIEFLSGTLADRNFWGQVAAGMRMDEDRGGQIIEVYTSLPDSILVGESKTPQILERTRITNFAFKKEQIVISLLEELRHAVQEKLGIFNLGDGSFEAQSVTELRKLDYEADAEAFTKALARYLLPYVEIARYDVPELSEMYVDSRSVKDLIPKGLAKYLDTSLVAQVRETDPPGLYLSQNLERLNITDEAEVDKFVTQVFRSLDSRKIGFVEARFMLNKLKDALSEVGDILKVAEVKQRIAEIS